MDLLVFSVHPQGLDQIKLVADVSFDLTAFVDDARFGDHMRQGRAALKIQVRLDLCTGALSGPLLQDGRCHDRMLVDLAGPNSQRSFEIFVGKDKARTPLLMRIPFDLGTFSLKLLR